MMWKQIRSLFGRKSTGGGSQLDFDVTRSDVESVLALNLATETDREKHSEQVLNTLKRLDAEIETIRQRANGYPAGPISADVWLNGAGYANLTCALTQHFKKAGWLKREENASALWAKATLAVCSHYHHMVGPAMVANADCHERLGDSERASQMYSGVVKDFAFLLDDWDDESDAPSDDDRLAIESLKIATDRLLAGGTNQLDSISLVNTQSRAESILSRTDTDT